MQKERTITQTTNKYILKYVIWNILNVLVRVIPIGVVIIINREKYFKEHTSWTSLGIILALLFIVLSFLKVKWLKGCTLTIFLFVMIFALRFIINDLVLIFGMYTIGDVISTLITSKFVARYDRLRKVSEDVQIQNHAIREQTQSIVNAINGRG